MSRYAIIGGGIAGASVAYHLSERTDDPVTVYERGRLASETTRKSMAMFGLYGDETQYRMKRYGLRLYNRFFDDPRADPRYSLMGRLGVATTDEGAAALEAAVSGSGERGPKVASGVDRDLVEYVPGGELDEVVMVPPLETDAVVGAAYRPRVGYMQPRELALEFAERARENGATFETGVEVTEVTTRGGRVAGLVVDGEEVAADEVVCAAGPWNVEVARGVGVDLPVGHTLAPIMKLRPPRPAPYTFPEIGHHESPYAFYRQAARDSGMFYVGYNPTREIGRGERFEDVARELDPDEVGESVPDDIREGAWEVAEELLPSLLDAEVVDEWTGVRSATPDGNPIVGWTDLEGFSIAAFHTSGIQLSPAVGRTIASQLVDGDPTELYDALSLSRFDGYTDVHGGDPPRPS